MPKWEHVSVSAKDFRGERVPTWEEMTIIKRIFWKADECVIQYHPPERNYVNHHPHVLHLWHPLGIELPMPPIDCV